MGKKIERILTGSQILREFGCSWRNFEGRDTDSVICSPSEGNPAEDFYVLPQDVFDLIEHEDGALTLSGLYTMKLSHLAWNRNWQKHAQDAIYRRGLKGVRFIPEMYFSLKQEWQKLHGDKSFLSLAKKKEDFFNDNVVYLYDHENHFLGID